MKNLKNKMKSINGITLIALVITIIILIILAGITINMLLGDNGILTRAKDADLLNKKAQYIEEIQLEIADEHMERLSAYKEEPFIVSLQKRLQGTESASEGNVKVYTKKSWVDKAEINLNTVLVVYTVDGYQILVDVNNSENTATIRQASFAEKGKECTISFNGNTGSGSMDSISITQGLGIFMPENNFAKTSYTFVGWYKNAEGEGDRYNPGEVYTVTDDETFYAKWSQHAITITYNANGGTGTMNDTIIEIGDKDNLIANTYTKTGYTFAGWKDQDNNTYTNQQEITAEKDLILTAQWTINQYTISYELDGGTITTANPTTFTVDTNTITLNNPTKTGYTFTGWSGTGLTGDTNLTINIPKGSTGNRLYYAHWEKQKIYQWGKYQLITRKIYSHNQLSGVTTMRISSGSFDCYSNYTFSETAGFKLTDYIGKYTVDSTTDLNQYLNSYAFFSYAQYTNCLWQVIRVESGRLRFQLMETQTSSNITEEEFVEIVENTLNNYYNENQIYTEGSNRYKYKYIGEKE